MWRFAIPGTLVVAAMLGVMALSLRPPPGAGIGRTGIDRAGIGPPTTAVTTVPAPAATPVTTPAPPAKAKTPPAPESQPAPPPPAPPSAGPGPEATDPGLAAVPRTDRQPAADTLPALRPPGAVHPPAAAPAHRPSPQREAVARPAAGPISVAVMLDGARQAIHAGAFGAARSLLLRAQTRLVFAPGSPPDAAAGHLRTRMTVQITDALASLGAGDPQGAQLGIEDAIALARGLD